MLVVSFAAVATVLLSTGPVHTLRDKVEKENHQVCN